MEKMVNKNNAVLKIIQDGYNLHDAYFKVNVEKARTRKDIATVLGLEQLTGNRLEKFYVETDEVRNANTISSLEQLLNNPLEPFTKRLFSGFMGSGKTTELIKLCFEMNKDLNVIIFSAWNRLKINEITIEALLFEIVEDVLNYLYSNNLVDEEDELLKDIVDSITEWCFETLTIKEKNLKTERSRSAGIKFLKGLFFSAKTERRTVGTDKTHSSRLEERKINDLIFECNKIFDYLRERTGMETLIVIDDLEKMDFIKAREFYTSNSGFIRDFHCKMLMTVPVELIYHSDFSLIQAVFGQAEVLPMIKTKDESGKVYQPGVDCLTEILRRRLDLSLFENHCYETAIKYSGGSIRDLFHIIQRAALVENSEKITESSMQKGVNINRDDIANKITERDDEIKIKFEEYLEVLFDIYDGNKKAPERKIALLDLLRVRAVLKYNGEGFYDTHPLLESFIEAYKNKMQKKNGTPKRD